VTGFIPMPISSPSLEDNSKSDDAESNDRAGIGTDWKTFSAISSPCHFRNPHER
jgi:hypothetical protein